MSEKTESAPAAARPAPTLTIGLPVYNGEKYLESALASLAAQTFTDYEAGDLRQRLDRPHRGDLRRPRRSRPAHPVRAQPDQPRRHGQLRPGGGARHGELFMWAAHDDLWEPRFIERMVGALRANPEAGLAYCNYDWGR